jgi:two-component system, LytTR family, response regulator
MTVILIDDEVKSLNGLALLLKKYCPHVNILAACSDVETALDKIDTLQPDLLCLDISMPGKNGFELLQEVSMPAPEVIFVTAHHRYMLQAFKFSAVDYLLKPVDKNELIDAVNRAGDRISKKKETGRWEVLVHNMRLQSQSQEIKLCIPSYNGFEVILLKDVIYCEAESSYTKFHLPNKKQVVASKTIKEYETLLANNFFIRVHRSWLINLSHVKEYRRGEDGIITMTNGQEIRVAKRKKEFFLQKMKEFSKF